MTKDMPEIESEEEHQERLRHLYRQRQLQKQQQMQVQAQVIQQTWIQQQQWLANPGMVSGLVPADPNNPQLIAQLRPPTPDIIQQQLLVEYQRRLQQRHDLGQQAFQYDKVVQELQQQGVQGAPVMQPSFVEVPHQRFALRPSVPSFQGVRPVVPGQVPAFDGEEQLAGQQQLYRKQQQQLQVEQQPQKTASEKIISLSSASEKTAEKTQESEQRSTEDVPSGNQEAGARGNPVPNEGAKKDEAGKIDEESGKKESKHSQVGDANCEESISEGCKSHAKEETKTKDAENTAAVDTTNDPSDESCIQRSDSSQGAPKEEASTLKCREGDVEEATAKDAALDCTEKQPEDPNKCSAPGALDCPTTSNPPTQETRADCPRSVEPPAEKERGSGNTAESVSKVEGVRDDCKAGDLVTPGDSSEAQEKDDTIGPREVTEAAEGKKDSVVEETSAAPSSESSRETDASIEGSSNPEKQQEEEQGQVATTSKSNGNVDGEGETKASGSDNPKGQTCASQVQPAPPSQTVAVLPPSQQSLYSQQLLALQQQLFQMQQQRQFCIQQYQQLQQQGQDPMMLVGIQQQVQFIQQHMMQYWQQIQVVQQQLQGQGPLAAHMLQPGRGMPKGLHPGQQPGIPLGMLPVRPGMPLQQLNVPDGVPISSAVTQQVGLVEYK